MPDATELAPPAASAAPATESSAPVPSSPNAGSGAWDALDALGSDDGAPTAPETPAADPARPKDPQSGKFVKVEKPAEPPKPEPPKEVDPNKMKAGELAKHYHALKKEREEWVKQKADYEAKLKTPTEWPEKKTWEEKVAQHQKELEAERKRVAEYETELRFTQYEKSQEYKEKYQKPFETAYLAGRSKAAALKVVERKNEEGEVLQQSRQGTAEDFDALMRITDDDVAADKAAEMFGNKAPMVLYHRERANELNGAATNAIKEYREKGAEREKHFREQHEKWQKDASSMVEREMAAATEKYPQFFKPDDADPKSAQLLELGREALERVMRGGIPLKKGQKQWTNEELAKATAQIRNGAIAFPRVARSLSMALKEIKDLKSKLSEFEVSVPGNGDGHGRTTVPQDKTPEQMLEAMATESRR
jgi:hypothetical protein